MNITILGCGAYGTALSTILKDKNKITMWNKFDKELSTLKKDNPTIEYTTNLKESTINSKLIIIAIPITFLEDTIKELAKVYNKQSILIASKGIDTNNNFFAHQIINKYIKTKNIGAISGGTFAIDMQNKNVMGLTLGTKSTLLKKQVQKHIENKYLKIQYTTDLIGVEICGSIKNVIAIGFGILDGAKYPESTKFLYLTEAIYEINNFILSFKGNRKTIMSYAGIDDIIMTCTSDKSRNHSFGYLIGQNSSKEIINDYKNNNTIEGLGTTKAIYNLAKNNNIKLNICNIIYNILYNNYKYNSLIEYLENKESTF